MAKKDKQDEKPRESTVEFLASLAGVLVTGLFIITFILQAFEIPSASMVKTLLIGDHVLVNRVQFSPHTHRVGPLVPYSQIHHDDIVVFLSVDPRTPELYIVKRIIGLPGDRIHLRDGVVYRNGEKLNETYVNHSDQAGFNSYDPYRDNFPAVSAGDQPNVLIADIGDLFPGRTLSAAPCSFTGHLIRPRTSISKRSLASDWRFSDT